MKKEDKAFWLVVFFCLGLTIASAWGQYNYQIKYGLTAPTIITVI